MTSLFVELLCLLVAGATAVLWVLADRTRHHRDLAERAARAELSDALAIARTTDEAAELVARHLEHGHPERTVQVVLDDRAGAEHPCVALRLGRPHDSDGLIRCPSCAGTPGDATPSAATCWPLVVRGQALGSVLVRQPATPGADERCQIREAVAHAAPVVGALHAIAGAEARAAVDPVTGLPTRRVVSDTLRRMLAQAGRSVASLALLAIDLDHFDELNADFGRERGDAVLSAVGSVLQGVIRESDFVGRLGNEEFVVLAPDTGVEGAIVLAENLRRAISAIDVPGVERAVTVSIGVAAVPEHAGGFDDLLRAGDRALVSAKDRGRDRVVVVGSAS